MLDPNKAITFYRGLSFLAPFTLIGAVVAAGFYFMRGVEILTAGIWVASFAILASFIKFFVNASPGFRLERTLKIFAEVFSLCAAILACIFFLNREEIQSQVRAEAEQISATRSWLSTETVRELTSRLCSLERRVGVEPEARANSRLKCPPP